MKCWKCGSDLVQGAIFCNFCGAKQDQGTPPPRQTPPSYGGGGNTIVLTVFAAICMAVCGGLAVRSLFRTLGWVLNIGWFGPFTMILMAATELINAALLVVMAIACGLTAFKRNARNSDGLLVCLAAGGAGFLAVRLLSMLLTFFFRYFTGFSGYASFGSFILSILGVAAAVGGIYIIEHFVLGEFPLTGKTVDDLKLDVIEALHSFQQSAGEMGAQASQAAQNARAEREARAAAQAQYTQQDQYQYNQYDDSQYQQYGAQYGQGYVPFRPKADRNLIAYILLTFITCGFYSWYFIYELARDVNLVCAGDGKTTPGVLKLVLLSIVTCGFYGFYWYYSLGNRLAENAPRYGMNFQENGTTVLLWYLVGAFVCGIGPFVAMYIIIKNTNALCGAYNYQNGI